MEANTLVNPGLAAVIVPGVVVLRVMTEGSLAVNVNCPKVAAGIVQGAVVPSEAQTVGLVLSATAVKTCVWPLEMQALPMGFKVTRSTFSWTVTVVVAVAVGSLVSVAVMVAVPVVVAGVQTIKLASHLPAQTSPAAETEAMLLLLEA